MRRALALTCLLLITACGERKTGVYDGGRTIVCNPIEDCITMAYKIETNIWLGYVLNAETAGWTEEVSPAGANDLLGVWAIAHNDIYTCGQSQKIQHWNGTTWAEVDDVGGNALYTLWGADASNIWAVGVGDTVRYYNGSTWANRATGSGQTLYGVFGVSATTLWAVGNNGTIRKTTNGGSSWINQDNGTGALNAIWMADSSEGWVVGDGGVVRHTTNGGSTWPTESSGTTEGLLGVWGFSNSDVFAVGANGTIIHWDGVAWSAQTSGTSEWLRAIWGSHGNRVYAVGGTFSSNYLILIYDGISWSQDTSAGAKSSKSDSWRAWEFNTGSPWRVTALTIRLRSPASLKPRALFQCLSHSLNSRSAMALSRSREPRPAARASQ